MICCLSFYIIYIFPDVSDETVILFVLDKKKISDVPMSSFDSASETVSHVWICGVAGWNWGKCGAGGWWETGQLVLSMGPVRREACIPAQRADHPK
jgi:hypothetical protein